LGVVNRLKSEFSYPSECALPGAQTKRRLSAGRFVYSV